jgi:hypothetical protein
LGWLGGLATSEVSTRKQKVGSTHSGLTAMRGSSAR